jgi:hypothetical protein
VAQVDSDLENVRDGVMDDHGETQDHDKGRNDVRGDEGSIAIDDEDVNAMIPKTRDANGE